MGPIILMGPKVWGWGTNTAGDGAHAPVPPLAMGLN